MGSLEQEYHGTIRFDIPDHSITPEMRGFYGPPGAKEVIHERLPLYNYRTDTSIVKGPAGLDVQGFTYVNHTSALKDREQWLTEKDVMETYIPEIEALVREVTGAKRTVANNVFLRRRLADQQQDPKWYLKRDSELDQMLAKLPTDRNYIFGQTAEDESLPPARMAHNDYSIKGLRDSVRYCRPDIKAAGQEALDAEDAKAENVPRYAAYSVWRPLKPIKRDPLAVCDWRTMNGPNDLQRMQYRVLSGVTESGEYMMDGYLVAPPEHPVKHRWYFMPEQKPDEVLILKFADTLSETDPDVAGGCGHVSPILEGEEEGEPRNSIEIRVFAFW